MLKFWAIICRLAILRWPKRENTDRPVPLSL